MSIIRVLGIDVRKMHSFINKFILERVFNNEKLMRMMAFQM